MTLQAVHRLFEASPQTKLSHSHSHVTDHHQAVDLWCDPKHDCRTSNSSDELLLISRSRGQDLLFSSFPLLRCCCCNACDDDPARPLVEVTTDPKSYPSQLIISHPSRPMYHQSPNSSSSSSSRNKASWGCRDLLSTSKQMMPSRVKLRHRTSFLLKSLSSPFAIAGRLKRRRDLVDVSIATSSPPSIVSGRLQHLLQNNSLLARLAKGSVPF